MRPPRTIRSRLACAAAAACLLAAGNALLLPGTSAAATCGGGALQQVMVNGRAPGPGHSVPVVFVHGINSTAGMWDATSAAAPAARLPGVTAWTFDYGPENLDWVSNPAIGPSLASALTCLAQASGHRVIIVAHSMGGLAAQDAIGGPGSPVAGRVAELITLGTPFAGSDVLTIAEKINEGLQDLSDPNVAFVEALLSLCAGVTTGLHVNPCWIASALKAPVGTALQSDSADIGKLPAWPPSLPVLDIAGDMDVFVGVVRFGFHAHPGDGAVTTSSATAHGTAGSLDEPCAASIVTIFSARCFHTKLPYNADVIAAVLAAIEGRPLLDMTWTPTQMPVPADAATSAPAGANEFLSGISCPAPGNCVAVGSYTDAQGNSHGLIDALSHGTWTPAQAPLPGAAAAQSQVSLSGVSCPAAGTCVAVGTYADQSGHVQGLIETLSHGGWAPALAPPLGSAGVPLGAVACAAVGSCVATGSYTDQNMFNQAVFETLTRGTWSAAVAPLPGPATANSLLDAVACPAAGTCVATGGYNVADSGQGQGLIETLSHGSWTPRVAPLPPGASSSYAVLPAVACPARGACVAVGAYDWNLGGPGTRALIETLSHGTWTASAAPGQPGASGYASLAGVACPDVGVCVATGTYNNTPLGIIGSTLPWTETLSPASWTPGLSVPVPGPGGLGAVACPTAADCDALVVYNHPFAVTVEAGRAKP